ncbi:hypothetical protein NIA71_08160 [Ihubacter massiliensis]|uniref:Uncharacterized protein n=1 Tax=Hominibacterium faecale TaxID=2839743 RepID=A0A9J6QZQ9_9FIRM|nr:MULTISPECIES: hypothetical protein [Eubacteriales Family XIII. Incertae Sedis]MCO7121923.1 hypothetical protein [Ihubacter massiliensis]MCU7380938.1 hypothetical protein [Hominibacterium faecale]
MIKKTWEDIDDILFDGNKDEIAALRCPECGGTLKFVFNKKTMGSVLECTACGAGQRGNGAAYVPNAVKYFGKSITIGK